jgi:spore maturation protein CgeB
VRILCVFGEHNYGDPARGISHEYANFIPAMRRLGHDVAFFETWNRSPYKDFSDLNSHFLEKVEKQKPDIIFCVLLGYEIWLETFDFVRKYCPALIINWSTDDSWKYEEFSRFVASAFDIYATTSFPAVAQSWNDGHQNFVYTQWAANAENLAEPFPAEACRFKVSFIGSAYGNRPKWIEKLSKRGIDVTCFGHGWPHGAIDARDIPRIIRESVICLNFGDSELMLRGIIPVRSRQIKARVFEVPGAGGCLVTEHAEGLEEYYSPGKEVIVFEGISDLEEKIRYLLGHEPERDRIAWAGHVRTRNEHTYDLRFQRLLGFASQGLASPVNKSDQENLCKIDMTKFEAVEASYRTGPLLQWVKTVLEWACTVVWGSKRGPRAARRVLYELSWRILGKRTYTASGLPGRLFYHES